MTKIEKIKTETYVAYAHPEINEKINELVEVTNGMQDILAEYKTMIQEAKQMSLKADLSINYLGEQIKALQKIVAGDQLAKEINDGLDRVYGTCAKNTQDELLGNSEDLLVPDEVEFVRFDKWEDSGIGLLFGDGQVLYLDGDVWYVDNINSGWRKVKCRLVPCNSLDLQAGDWFIQKKEDVSEVDNYYLYLGEGDHRTSKGAYACLHDGVSVYEIFGDMDGYKVQPIE